MAKGKGSGNVTGTVWKLAQPIAESLGLQLWDVRFVKEGADWFLRIFIDKKTGVTINDCEVMSKAVDGPLDELDPIEQSYCLEVCSPGIDRELTRPEHFSRYMGSTVTVKLIRPLENGTRELTGELTSYENHVIGLTPEGSEPCEISEKDTSSVRLKEEYEDFVGGFDE